MSDDLINDTTLIQDLDPEEDLEDDPEEDVDGIRRDPTYPYHPCTTFAEDTQTGGGNKQHDPHQKYHHYTRGGYNVQSSHNKETTTTTSKNQRSSDSSKENVRRHKVLPKSSNLTSQQKKQHNLPRNSKYFHPQETGQIIDAKQRKRESRHFDARNGSRRRYSNQNHKNTNQKEFRKSSYIPSPYHEEKDTKILGQEKNNNGLIKNHTRLMDQIMEDLVAEATDNEGQYYLDLAGNVRKV